MGRVSGAALQAARQTLRQPRYARLFAVMAFVALVCVGAGTWQILRFDEKVHDNDRLTTNAKVGAAPVASVLPLVGAPAPSRDAVEYRLVEATGTYDVAGQVLARLRSVGGDQGFYVVTPLTTAKATLLVVRGFLPARADGSAPATIAAPPKGPVTVRARAQQGESGTERPQGIPAGQVSKISPSALAARLSAPVYNGYVQLLARQPGAAGLTALPAPDLSNPAGGAVEPQHFAYIIQWYLFAGLALAAPFAMARAERRERDRSGEDDNADEVPRLPTTPQPDREPLPRQVPEPAPQPVSDEQRRAAKLADRYGH